MWFLLREYVQGFQRSRIIASEKWFIFWHEQSTSETPETEELKEWNIMKNYNYKREDLEEEDQEEDERNVIL